MLKPVALSALPGRACAFLSGLPTIFIPVVADDQAVAHDDDALQ